MPIPYTIIAVSWSNDGTSVDLSTAATPYTGCKRCPPGYVAESGLLASAGNPQCALVLNFPTLAAALAWKSTYASSFDFVCWQPTGQCC